MAEPDAPRNPYHRARWRALFDFNKTAPIAKIETVSKGRVTTYLMINGRMHESQSILTLPRVRFLERGE